MPDKTQDAQLNFKLFKTWVCPTCYMEHILGKIYTYTSPQITRDTLTLKDSLLVVLIWSSELPGAPHFLSLRLAAPACTVGGSRSAPDLAACTQTLRALGEPGGAVLSTRDFLSPRAASCPICGPCAPWCLTLFAPHWLSLGLPPRHPESRLRRTEDGGWVHREPWESGGRVGASRWGGCQPSRQPAGNTQQDPVALTQRRTVSLHFSEAIPAWVYRGAPRRKLAEKPIIWGAAQLQPRLGGSGGAFQLRASRAFLTSARSTSYQLQGVAARSVPSGWHLYNCFPSFP